MMPVMIGFEPFSPLVLLTDDPAEYGKSEIPLITANGPQVAFVIARR